MKADPAHLDPGALGSWRAVAGQEDGSGSCR